jgi:hypothetical protein
MPRMDTRTTATAMLLGALALAGCGGAKAPGNCPAGTVLKGSDCVADDSSSGDDAPGTPPPKGEDSATGGGGGTPYDKDAIEVQLKRAARQVKSGCGSASDDSGQATGPWGQLKVSVVLGRNGHVKGITIPDPYNGKPVGICIAHAFQKLIFPPYSGDTDTTVDWDVELVQPGK